MSGHWPGEALGQWGSGQKGIVWPQEALWEVVSLSELQGELEACSSLRTVHHTQQSVLGSGGL